MTVLADRGCGDQVLDELLDTWGWSYVIRFRGAIRVEYEGEQKPASHWLSPTGRPRRLDHARVTADNTSVGAVVSRHRGMTDVLGAT